MISFPERHFDWILVAKTGTWILIGGEQTISTKNEMQTNMQSAGPLLQVRSGYEQKPFGSASLLIRIRTSESDPDSNISILW